MRVEVPCFLDRIAALGHGFHEEWSRTIIGRIHQIYAHNDEYFNPFTARGARIVETVRIEAKDEKDTLRVVSFEVPDGFTLPEFINERWTEKWKSECIKT